MSIEFLRFSVPKVTPFWHLSPPCSRVRKFRNFWFATVEANRKRAVFTLYCTRYIFVKKLLLEVYDWLDIQRTVIVGESLLVSLSKHSCLGEQIKCLWPVFNWTFQMCVKSARNKQKMKLASSLSRAFRFHQPQVLVLVYRIISCMRPPRA